MIRFGSSPCCALLISIAACVTPAPREHGAGALGDTDAATAVEDVSLVLAPGGGLKLAERGGAGPFHVSTKHVVGGRVVTLPHPSSEWTCDVVTAGNTPDGRHVLISRMGCRVPGPDGALVDGDFDVHQLFSTTTPGEATVRAWVHNRLAVGIDVFRMILRIDPSSMPARGDDVYLSFANDELARDPVRHMTYGNRDGENAFLWTGGYVVESDVARTGFYANRGNTKPALSIHTPRWGLLLHETDPINAQTGALLVGSNDGALELGYEYLLPHDFEAGNGTSEPIEIGAGFRAVGLPAREPPARGYWEAAAAYRAWGLETGLIPEETLPEAAFPAAWAQDCLYESFNVNLNVPVDWWADAVERMVRFNQGEDGRISARSVEDGGQRRFCPLLWSWSHSGPYAPAPGVLELLERFEQIEQDHDVEIHPLIYVLSAAVDERATRGTVLEDAWAYDELGNAYLWDGAAAIDTTHPAFRDHVAQAVDEMTAHGVDGVYFDAPFAFAQRDYRRHGGADRAFQVGVRDMMLDTADRLTRAGGGVIVHELAVAGLPGLQGGTALMLPNAANVPFSEALWHDRQIGAFSGDLGIGLFAIAFADPRFSTCTGACDPGLPDNLRHVQRLAIEGAVHGRAGVEIPPGLISGGWLFEMSDGERANPIGAAAYTLVTESMPNALAARRRIAALRTGRMLAPPTSDSPRVEVGWRIGQDGHRVYPRAADLYPSALYEDIEAHGARVLVVGNPTETPAVVTFALDDGTTVAVEVPALDIASVELSAG